MESADLARWQRFAAKGGIGKATALVDRIAERDGDLMFLKDDQVTVLMQLPQAGYYLGFCEGVVGRFAVADVQVHGKLKRAVMARRPASGNPGSPSASPIALTTTPSPVVPHTTYSPVHNQSVDNFAPNAHSGNSLVGVSAWLASQPSPQQQENPEPEAEPAEPHRIESISSHPSSSHNRDSPPNNNTLLPNSKSADRTPPASPAPLRVDTAAVTAQRESQSLASLVSTEASPLSDTSAYSFHRQPGTTEFGQEYEEQPRRNEAHDHRNPSLITRNSPAQSQPPLPRDADANSQLESSYSRTSSSSVGDPFQHDEPSSRLSQPAALAVSRGGALQLDTTGSSLTSTEIIKTPLADGGPDLGVQVREEQEEGLYNVDRGSKDSLHSDEASAASRWDQPDAGSNTRVVSDGAAEIGLSLLGGLLGAGGGDTESESDYGQASEDESLTANRRYEKDPSQKREASEGLRASQSQASMASRSFTPPFGFELESTTNTSEAAGRQSLVQTEDEDAELAVGDIQGTPAQHSRDTSADNAETPTESPRKSRMNIPSPAPAAAREGDLSDESDYGEQVQRSPVSFARPQRPSEDNAARRLSVDSFQHPADDADFDLPPVRPPYHRSSTSVRSFTSSDAGGYYDDGIYDHYRYSQASMAARSIRMSMFAGAEEVPPLPNGSELEKGAGVAERRGREQQFAPLNLSSPKSSHGPMSSPGSQAQFSPSLHGPKSPSIRSPLGQGEPTSPPPMIPEMPISAGLMLRSQTKTADDVEIEAGNEDEGKQADRPSLTLATETTGLAPSATTGGSSPSPGGLAPPLSPNPSVPPSPSLSSNLASTLRQALEQQRGPEPEPEPEMETKSIDEGEPVPQVLVMETTPPQGQPPAYEPSPIASLQRRPSRFAPHPNAPKPAHMFNSNYLTPGEGADQSQSGPPQMLLHEVLQLVAQRLRAGELAGRSPTIHGRTQSELALSSVPVPISFVFDPDGRSTFAFNRVVGVPQRAIGVAQRSASMNASPGSPARAGEYVGSKLRPRSRSFSEVPQEQLLVMKVAGETSSAPQTPSLARLGSAANTAPSTPLTPGLPTQPATPGPSQGHTAPATPIVPNTPVHQSPIQSSPSSPVKHPVTPSPNAPSPGTSKSPFRGLRQVASNTMMRVGLHSNSIPSRQSSDNFQRPTNDSSAPGPQRKPSADITRSGAGLAGVYGPSPASISSSPMASSNISLPSKVSSPGLRMTRGNGPLADTPTTPLSPAGSAQLAEETVHYNDMDFDMIKPVRGRVSLARTSEEGRQSISRSSQHSDLPRTQQDDEGPESSPVSPIAPTPMHQARTPSTSTLLPKAGSHNSLTTSDSITAHISREQRWISTMQTVSSSSVRRNKKIKKLLLEGVPASVRGVVWLYLTDSKARRMAGLYSQLGKRGKVPATVEIVKDIQQCFAAQPHLQAPDGPVASILQAYLTMVPDVTYSRGLCQAAGNLLLHSPEEDAFWTFVALMDKHLRGYCALNSLQMEADAIFFAKTLESNDSQLAAKLFRELGLQASDFCKPWILSGFVGAVPPEYSCRIWDVFLFEGTPFLFRVALALLIGLKKQLMVLTPNSSPSALDILLSVPSQLLPTDPDQLIASAYSVKFKDDDMRKSRPKTEAQLRKEPGFARPALNTLRK